MKVLVRVSGTERMANKEGIFSFLEIVRRGVIADQAGKGMRTTGQTASSLVIQELRKGAQLAGDDSFQQQIAGRRPGKFMPPEKALAYVKNKGMIPHPDKYGRIPSLKSLAYLINRKIATKGTDIFLGKRPGLDVQGIVEQNEPTLRDSFVKAGKIAITTGIAKALGRKAQRLQA